MFCWHFSSSVTDYKAFLWALLHVLFWSISASSGVSFDTKWLLSGENDMILEVFWTHVRIWALLLAAGIELSTFAHKTWNYSWSHIFKWQKIPVCQWALNSGEKPSFVNVGKCVYGDCNTPIMVFSVTYYLELHCALTLHQQWSNWLFRHYTLTSLILCLWQPKCTWFKGGLQR